MGAVVGIPNISTTASSILGIISIFVSTMLFVAEEGLEVKVKINGKKEKEIIDFEIYKNIIENSLYNNFPTHMIGAYKSDRGEYFGRKKMGASHGNKYLNERLKEINRDPKRVSELTAINHTQGKVYDELEVKKRRDELLLEYHKGKIDETEFARELNDSGELTGGKYNPGYKHLSVKVMGHPVKIYGQGTNIDLARALHARILQNSPSYEADCEFHYSKEISTRHHSSELKTLKKELIEKSTDNEPKEKKS